MILMRALIIGIRGQDGTFLKSILVENGYAVFGVLRPLEKMAFGWQNDVSLSITQKGGEIEIDLADPNLCKEYLNLIKPDRIFHLAAEHGPSLEMAEVEKYKSQEMYNCHAALTRNLLEWIKENRKSKLVVALTSQMYTPSLRIHKINENDVYAPQNLYAKTKLDGFDLIKKYRQEYDLFAVGLILFNHTSEIAKPSYLFNMLAQQLIEFRNQERKHIIVQNALQKIDICDASEVCDAIYKSIEYKLPKDFVISSGELSSIESIILEAAQILKIQVKKENIHSLQNQKDITSICGDPAEVFKHLNWKARKNPAQILAEMTNFKTSDRAILRKNL